MPRYGEKATLYPPGSTAVFRWRLLSWMAPGGATVSTGTWRPGRELTGLGPLSGTTWNNWQLSAVDNQGLSAAETLARLSGAATLTLASGADTIALAATLGAALFVENQDLRDTPNATGDFYEFTATGKTSTPSAGAAVADWTNAAVTLAVASEAAPATLWVDAVDSDSIAAPPPEEDLAIATQYARESATLETRWRSGVLAGRALRWRDRNWQVVNADEDGRRRTLRLDVARTATF